MVLIIAESRSLTLKLLFSAKVSW